MNKLRLLVFSASYGSGHVKAAEALIQAFQHRKPHAEITHLDFGECLNKQINFLIRNTYITMIKRTPKLWGLFYYGIDRISAQSILQNVAHKIGQRELLKYINNVKPDFVVCTYPIVAGILARLRLKGLINVPLVTVITDYVVHSEWIHQGVDLYIVGNEFVYTGLVHRGIDPERIRVTGIPVNPKFEVETNRQRVARQYGLSLNQRTVLIMGGGYGVLNSVQEMCHLAARTTTPTQVIVVCGKDKKLYESLGEIIQRSRNPIVRLGFIDNIDELMSVADIIITKAGGLTVSEALTKKLPLLIFRPIPGQEMENANFLVKNGAGLVVNSLEELEYTLNTLLKHPEKLKSMQDAAAEALPGNAAKRAVEFILQLTNQVEIEQKIG